PPGPALGVLTDNIRDLDAVADEEEQSFSGLAAATSPAPVARVPLLGTDVHDVDGLIAVADALFRGDPGGGDPRGDPGGGDPVRRASEPPSAGRAAVG
ncbi:MAG: hypothetical protein M0010_20045, partial [Actinomycetota bacterium]|nr:hypothetical protein [Actinomycetota bacterium]